MPEKNIPDQHHVVRHCPKNRTIRVSGEVVGVIPRLFELRAHKNETYLSASYFEYFHGSAAERISQCIQATPREIKDTDFMVLMNVAKTKSIAKACKHNVRVLHETAHRSNPAYARIRGVPFDPKSVALTLLAKEAKDKLFAVGTHRDISPQQSEDGEEQKNAPAELVIEATDTDAAAVPDAPSAEGNDPASA